MEETTLMAGPWEKYQSQSQEGKPWEKYQANSSDIVSPAAKPAADTTLSKTESLLRGASQGATFNFQDEVSPYIEKFLGKVTGNEAYDNRPISDLQATYRLQNAVAKKANPGTFATGEVLGNVAATSPLIALNPAASIGTGEIFGGGIAKGAINLGKAVAVAAPEGALLGGTAAAGNAEDNKLSAFGQGAKTGAATSALLSAAGKPAFEVAGKITTAGVQKAQGITDDVLNYFRANPGKIAALQEAAKDKGTAIASLSDDLATSLSDSLNKAVTKENNTINQIVAKSGDTPINGQAVIDAFDKQISKLSKGGITSKAQSAISDLQKMKDGFLSKFSGDNSSALTADAVNVLRKEVNDEAKAAYQATIGNNPTFAKSADSVADALRDTLDVVDPEIRAANGRLKNLIDARQEVASKFGAKSFNNRDNDIDPADVQKILARYGNESKATTKKLVDSLSESLGVDLPSAADFHKALKSIDPNNGAGFSKYLTGHSLVLPLLGLAGLGGSAYAAGHGDPVISGLGLAAGAIGGAALQSRGGLNTLINAPAIGNVLNQTGSGLRRIISEQRGKNAAQ